MLKDPLGREVGQPLDPTRHNVDDLAIRRVGQPRLYSAVWMQNPRTLGGNVIKTDWFEVISPSKVPLQHIRWVRGWDLAFSEKQVAGSNPDFTAGAKIGLYRLGDEYAYYVYDLQRWRESWPITRSKMLDIAKDDTPGVLLVVEGGGPQKGLGDDLKADPKFKQFRIRTVNPVSDKVARAQYWVDECEINKFYLVDTGWDMKSFVDECEIFPNGPKDDQIDSVSVAFWYLKDTFGKRGTKSVKVQGLYNKS